MTDEKPISEQLRDVIALAFPTGGIRSGTALAEVRAELHALLPAIERLEADQQQAYVLVKAARRLISLRHAVVPRSVEHTRRHQLKMAQAWTALESAVQSILAPSTPEPRESASLCQKCGNYFVTDRSACPSCVGSWSRPPTLAEIAEPRGPETAEVCAECGDEISGEPPFSMHKPMPESAYDHQPRTERSEPVGEERSEGEWRRLRERLPGVVEWLRSGGIHETVALSLSLERAIEAPWKARAEAAEAALERRLSQYRRYVQEFTASADLGERDEPWVQTLRGKVIAYEYVIEGLEEILRALSRTQEGPQGHAFQPVNGHPDDDECTYRADGTDATYCGHPKAAHEACTQEGGAQ